MRLHVCSYGGHMVLWRPSSMVWDAEADTPLRWATWQDLEQLPYGPNMDYDAQLRCDALPWWEGPACEDWRELWAEGRVTCWNCQHRYPETAAACPYCGADLEP